MQKQAVIDLVRFAGGRAHLARMLDKPISTVNSWIDRGRVSKEAAKEISEHSAFELHFPMIKLRPDL